MRVKLDKCIEDVHAKFRAIDAKIEEGTVAQGNQESGEEVRLSTESQWNIPGSPLPTWAYDKPRAFVDGKDIHGDFQALRIRIVD